MYNAVVLRGGRVRLLIPVVLGIWVPTAALPAQQLQAIEVAEIAKWLRSGESANVIVDRLTYRCLTQRLPRGAEANLRQAGGTDVVVLYVRQMIICPDAGGRDQPVIVRPPVRRPIGSGASDTSQRRVVDSIGRVIVDGDAGLGLSSIHAWYNPQASRPRIASLASALAGVGPAIGVRVWPVLSTRWGVAFSGAVARNLFVGDGFGEANATLWRAETRALHRLGRGQVVLDLGLHGRRGVRTRTDGIDTLRARVDFTVVRGGLSWNLDRDRDPLTGVEMGLLVERAPSGGGRPGGTHLGVRMRWADGPIFAQGEYVGGYRAAGIPTVLTNVSRTVDARDNGGGNGMLVIGLRKAWRLGRLR
jgi:hypothetical protein